MFVTASNDPGPSGSMITVVLFCDAMTMKPVYLDRFSAISVPMGLT